MAYINIYTVGVNVPYKQNIFPIWPFLTKILKDFMVFYSRVLTVINWQESWKFFFTHFTCLLMYCLYSYCTTPWRWSQEWPKHVGIVNKTVYLNIYASVHLLVSKSKKKNIPVIEIHSYGDHYASCCLLGYDAMQSGRNRPSFRRNVPSSVFEVEERSQYAYSRVTF
jgi:hypothetical protein